MFLFLRCIALNWRTFPPCAARYFTQLFVLEADGEPIQLEWVGAEIEGELLWAYLEAVMTEPPAEARVFNRLLFAAFDGQTNTVVATLGGPPRSFDFSDAADLWEVTFVREPGEGE